MAEVADGAIKASWPGLSRPSTKAQRIYAGKREKPCDRPPSCRSRRGGTRSCGGPAWMAGTSPAMTARVRRTNSDRPPYAMSQNCALIALAWRSGAGGGGGRRPASMAGTSPAIHDGQGVRRQARKARPSAFLPVAPRRDLFLRRPGVDGRDKPGHDGKGSTNEQQTGRPTDNAIRAKSRRARRRLDRSASSSAGRAIGAFAGLIDAPPSGSRREPP